MTVLVFNPDLVLGRTSAMRLASIQRLASHQIWLRAEGVNRFSGRYIYQRETEDRDSDSQKLIRHCLKHAPRFVVSIEPNGKKMTTTKYVDGFVIPLQKGKIDLYRTMAEKACRIWKEHGALEFRECVGDDLDVKDQVPFPQLAGTKPDETVIFSWIVFESRESRDQVNARVMADPRIKEMCDESNSPFDFKRMAYGGFKVLVDA
jgi:uncharacterized protein YbaA (DUF1428 family)